MHIGAEAFEALMNLSRPRKNRPLKTLLTTCLVPTLHVFRFVLRMRGRPATASRGLHFETQREISIFHSEQTTHVLTTGNNTHFTYFLN